MTVTTDSNRHRHLTNMYVMGVKKTQQMYKDTHRSTHNVRSIHSSSHVDMANLHNTRGFSFSQP